MLTTPLCRDQANPIFIMLFVNTAGKISPSITLVSGLKTEEELLEAEKFMIHIFGAQRYGYNICAGGRGAVGWKPSAETKAKMSAAAISGNHGQRLQSPENQAKRVPAYQKSLADHGGSFHKEGTVKKIRDARAKQDEAQRLIAFKGWYKDGDAERRARAADTHRGSKHDMTAGGSKAISDVLKRTNAKRWQDHSIVGQRFGRLVVESKYGPNYRGLLQWNCVCDCGGLKIATTSLLREGKVKSCGCLARKGRIV